MMQLETARHRIHLKKKAQGPRWLHGEFQASLGYKGLCHMIQIPCLNL